MSDIPVINGTLKVGYNAKSVLLYMQIEDDEDRLIMPISHLDVFQLIEALGWALRKYEEVNPALRTVGEA